MLWSRSGQALDEDGPLPAPLPLRRRPYAPSTSASPLADRRLRPCCFSLVRCALSESPPWNLASGVLMRHEGKTREGCVYVDGTPDSGWYFSGFAVSPWPAGSLQVHWLGEGHAAVGCTCIFCNSPSSGLTDGKRCVFYTICAWCVPDVASAVSQDVCPRSQANCRCHGIVAVSH